MNNFLANLFSQFRCFRLHLILINSSNYYWVAIQWRKEDHIVKEASDYNDDLFLVINGIKFYCENIEISEEVFMKLERFSLVADDEAYTVYFDGGHMVIC